MEGGSSIAVNRRGFIYVSGSEGITIFGPSDNGCVKTPLMISGPKTHLINAPVAVALDGYGNIYACYGGIDKSTFVAVFKANSSGDVSPIRMISGDNTRLSAPIAMTVDSFGNVYVLNQYRHGYNPPRPQFITGYRAGANGNVAPITTLIGPATEFNGPDGIGVSNRTGRLFVSNRDNSTITVYEAGASGNVAPIQVIGGFNTGLNQPTTLTVYEH